MNLLAPRRLIALTGTPAETQEAATSLLRELLPSAWIQVSDDSATSPSPSLQSALKSGFPLGAQTPSGKTLAPTQVRHQLGATLDALVFDLHGRIAASSLAQAEGLIRAGGALILRLPAEESPGNGGQERLRKRLQTALRRAQVERPLPGESLVTPPAIQGGSDEQAALVRRLQEWFQSPGPVALTLLAERGRGKSAALGLALRSSLEQAQPEGPAGVQAGEVILAGPSPESVATLRQFAGSHAPDFINPGALLELQNSRSLLIIDEAAQMPLPLLQRVVSRNPQARFVFSTTTFGYEGTGRGFALRFVPWLVQHFGEHLQQETLHTPIRYPANDPVELFVRDFLLLDARPHAWAPGDSGDRPALQVARVHRDELLADEDTLEALFGLLVQAHYRTTPDDFARLLDSPDISLHLARVGGPEGPVVGATLLSHELPLSAEDTQALLRGQRSLLGHALHESLVRHLGIAQAGALHLIRSVRIVSHPGARRLGIARALIEDVHRSYRPDAFGTLFGATADLLRFRQAMHYECVRLSPSRGARTGEACVVMLHPFSAEAHQLMVQLRNDFARDLPVQLELLTRGDHLVVDPEMAQALGADLPAPGPLSWRPSRIAGYVAGPLTFETGAADLIAFATSFEDTLKHLLPVERRLIELRALERAPWSEALQVVGSPGYPAVMRQLRRAFESLVRLALEQATTAPLDELRQLLEQAGFTGSDRV